MTGIYKVTSPAGKVYIGQSRNILKRKNAYKNNRCKGQSKLYHSILKYGFDSHRFDILIECSNILLNALESYLIDTHNSTDRFYGLNCMTGGAAPRHDSETRQKLSLSHKNKCESEPDYLEVLRSRLKKATTERGSYKRDQGVTDKIIATKTLKGTLRMKQSSIDKATATIRRKFAENPTEMKARMDEIRKLSPGNKKKVIDTSTGETWDCLKEMCDEKGINYKYKAKQLSGERKHNTPYKYVTQAT